jgi:hypothetical protein
VVPTIWLRDSAICEDLEKMERMEDLEDLEKREKSEDLEKMERMEGGLQLLLLHERK